MPGLKSEHKAADEMFPKGCVIKQKCAVDLETCRGAAQEKKTTGFKAWLRTLNTKRQLKNCSLKAADPRDNIKILQF